VGSSSRGLRALRAIHRAVSIAPNDDDDDDDDDE
jgi:hypothetical protein